MGTILVIARVALAVVFATAGVAKLADIDGSRRAAREFGLGPSLALPIAFLLPLAELVTAAALLPSGSATAGAAAALILLLVFAAAIGVSLARGRQPDCHCFGQIHSAPAGPGTLVRNLALAALAGVVLVAGRDDPGPSAIAWIAELGPGAAIAAGSALLLAALGGWLAYLLLRQHGRLLIRVDALEAALAERGIAVPQAAAGGVFVEGLPIGSDAPEFELESIAGDTASLAELLAAENPLLLVFTDPDCGPCRALLPGVARWRRAHAARLAIALISTGDAAAAGAVAAEHDLNDVLLVDNGEVQRAYRAGATPSAVLVSPDGTVASRIAQGEPAIERLVASAVESGSLPAVQVAGRDRGRNGSAVSVPRGGAPIGGRPEAITLPALDGDDVDLGALGGSETLLLFWNPGCGFCGQMLPDLKAWEASRPAGGPELLVVSTGSEETNRELGLRAPILLDDGFRAGQAFAAGGTPMAVLIDADGKVASEVVAGAQGFFALAAAEPVAGRPKEAQRG